MLINDNYLKNYLNINKELTENSAEGGEIKAYYDDTVLRKVIAAYYGETGKKVIDYYFWDNAIFFMFVQEYKYNSPVYVTEDMPEAGLEAYDESKTKITENRYYFTQNRLIRWLDNNKKKVDINSPLFIEKQKELLKDADFIKEKLIQ